MSDEIFEINKLKFLEELTELSRKYSMYIFSDPQGSEPFIVTDADANGEYSTRGSYVGLAWRLNGQREPRVDTRDPETIALENDFNSFIGGKK